MMVKNCFISHAGLNRTYVEHRIVLLALYVDHFHISLTGIRLANFIALLQFTVFNPFVTKLSPFS